MAQLLSTCQLWLLQGSLRSGVAAAKPGYAGGHQPLRENLGRQAQLPEVQQKIPEPWADLPHLFTLSQPRGLDAIGKMRTPDWDSRYMNQGSSVHPLCTSLLYRVTTDLIKVKDPLPRKMHIYRCPKTLYTIIGRNSGPSKTPRL